MNIWFTADEHYFHSNICRYCNRPFKNIKEHNETLIELHNNIVDSKDIVYHVGDLTMLSGEHVHRMKGVMNKLRGKHVLIMGNHDRFKPFTYVNELNFIHVHTFLEVGEFYLAHDPATVTVDVNHLWLCGHVHKLFKVSEMKNCINVGVDQWEYKPVHIDEIRRLLEW